MSQFSGLEGSQTLLAANFVHQTNSTRLKRTGEKCQKTSSIALIINIVPIDIGIYSLLSWNSIVSHCTNTILLISIHWIRMLLNFTKKGIIR